MEKKSVLRQVSIAIFAGMEVLQDSISEETKQYLKQLMKTIEKEIEKL